MILTPRGWQAMAQREAGELLGTHEGAAKLAEAKRYGLLADEIERLREALKWIAEVNAMDHEYQRIAREVLLPIVELTRRSTGA